MLLLMETKYSFMFKTDRGEAIYNRCVELMDCNDMLTMVDQGVLVGFSGGPDSVLLLCFLLEYKKRTRGSFHICACHIEHGIRGAEALRDLEFSRNICQELGVEFIEFSYDVPAIASEQSLCLEEAARNVRYSSFREIIQGRDDIRCIATAHNATDNIETVLLNILRGSGTAGGAGIPYVRDNIFRPLLCLAKREIVSFLDEVGISYVVDSTNISSEYSRNYIRNEILPKLMHLSADPERSFSRFCTALRQDDAFLSSLTSEIIDTNLDYLSVFDLRKLEKPLFVRAIMSFCHHHNVCINSYQISSIYDHISEDSFKITVGGGHEFVLSMGECRLVKKSEDRADIDFPLNYGNNKIEGFNGFIEVFNEDDFDFNVSSSNVYKFSIFVKTSSAIINGSLRVRFKKNGDSYKYNKMTHKLKKVFNDNNIPLFERDRIPVVYDDNGILWVPGLPCRDDGVSNKNTGLYLVFHITEPVPFEDKLYYVSKRSASYTN